MWFFVLFILDCIVAKAINYDTTVSYECSTSKNCAAITPNSMCFNKKCVCQYGYKFDGNLRCIYEKRVRRQINFGIQMLGELCQSNDECRRTPVDGTKACVHNRCECSTGHVPIDAYRCIRDFAPVENTQIIKSSPIEELPGYGSICLTNKDCQHATVLLECFHSTCVCLEGYVPLGKYLCYNIHGHDIPVIEKPTTTSPFSTTTLVLYSLDDDTVRFLNKLGNACTNDNYCRRSVSWSHCYNGKCSCVHGYIPLDSYTCIEDSKSDTTPSMSISNYKSLLGGNCKTNQHCQTPDAICLNNVCHCPRGYFPIDNWNCLEDPDASSEEIHQKTAISTTATTTTTTTTAATTTSTTGFLWWSWSSSSTTRQSFTNVRNLFPYRCLLNRQCTSMDRNSHCTSFGRCACNLGYKLERTNKGQDCIRKLIKDDDCD